MYCMYQKAYVALLEGCRDSSAWRQSTAVDIPISWLARPILRQADHINMEIINHVSKSCWPCLGGSNMGVGGLKRNMKTNPWVPHTSSHRHVKHSCSTVHPLLKSLSYRQQCIYQGSQVHKPAVWSGVAVYGKRVWFVANSFTFVCLQGVNLLPPQSSTCPPEGNTVWVLHALGGDD
jgi:hypothetical protein